MAIYTIADLHLSINDQTNKSMEVFGARWNGYVEKLEQHWRNTIKETDTVIIPGDISWALTLEEATQDLGFLHSLPGKKIIGKGNHDFWWSTATKLHAFFVENHIDTISLLHNNAYLVENKIMEHKLIPSNFCKTMHIRLRIKSFAAHEVGLPMTANS